MFNRDMLLALHQRAHASFNAITGHAGTLPVDALTKPLPGFGHPCLRDILVHIAESEDWWNSQLEGRMWEEWDFARYTDAGMIRDALHTAARRTEDFLSSQTDDSLGAVITVGGEGWSHDTRPGLVVLHVITHGFHHKGQAATACRILGSPAPDTDISIGV